MPTTRLLPLAVCLTLVGCGTTSPYGEMVISAAQRSRQEAIVLPRDPNCPPTCAATLAYWKGLKGGMPTGEDDTEQIRKKFRDYKERVRNLPVVGVDPELVEKVLVLVRELKNLTEISQLAHDEYLFSAPEAIRKEFVTTGAMATQACNAVNAMRPVLSQRYGVEFPAE
jgi:hypothetical protein